MTRAATVVAATVDTAAAVAATEEVAAAEAVATEAAEVAAVAGEAVAAADTEVVVVAAAAMEAAAVAERDATKARPFLSEISPGLSLKTNYPTFLDNMDKSCSLEFLSIEKHDAHVEWVFANSIIKNPASPRSII